MTLIWLPSQMATFAKVVELNGFSAAARALKVPKAAVSRAVAGLIEMDYLERRPSTDDARRSNLVLTEAGMGIYELIVPLALSEEARLVSTLSDKEQAELARLMGKLAKAASPERDLW